MDNPDDIIRMVELIDLCDDEQPSELGNYIEVDEDDDDVQFLGEISLDAATDAQENANRIEIQSVIIRGQQLRRDGTAELVDGDFLRVKKMYIDDRGHTQLQGSLLRRTKHLHGMLDQKVNEVCIISQSKSGQTGGAAAYRTTTRPLEEAIDIRECVFTNLLFPAHTWRQHLPRELHREDWRDVKRLASEQLQLTCRWRFTEEVDGNKVISQCSTRLSELEADAQKACSDVVLWRNYLHTQSDSGSSTPNKSKHQETDSTPLAQKRKTQEGKAAAASTRTITIADDDEDSEPEIVLVRRKSTLSTETVVRLSDDVVPQRPFAGRTPSRSKYTYGDICTGAGGMASGAVQAGLRMQFALDHDHDACETVRLNIKTRVLEEDVYTFCTKLKTRGYLRVDVLHISFPCKFFSPAHTIEGKDDEQNIATGYSVKPILERCRPRVLTMENTFGLLHTKNIAFFYSLIRQITDAGYSVRSKLINLADFGNPHARKRLIIIASCPGEPLPRFPEPTHGSGSGKKPYTTIHQILSRIDYPSVPAYMLQCSEKRGAEYSPHQPLKQAITCSGGLGNLHPSGLRSFMLVELSALQTFRPLQQYHGTYTSIKTQI
ncbi:hypothetical protein LTR95_008651, partial [Oleoguttula sp. CCFEE 5521]